VTPAARYEAARRAYLAAPRGQKLRKHGVMRDALHQALKAEIRKSKKGKSA
jgi:hypothetical protein